MSANISWAHAYLSGDATRAAGELCLAAMLAGATGDGRLGAEERSYVLATAAGLPGLSALAAAEREALVERAFAALTSGEARDTLARLAQGRTIEQRRAAYALACIAALADGVATDEELDHLMEIRDGLGLPDGEAADVEATVREGLGAREVFEEDGVSWRLAEPAVRSRAIDWARAELDPAPLAPYAGACVEAMVLAAAADGGLDAEEGDHIHELAERLPALGGIDGHELERFVLDAAGRIAREGAPRRLEALAGDLPPAVRRGAFVLAVVVALADQRATDEELLLLEEMRKRFGLSEADADSIIDAIREQVYG